MSLADIIAEVEKLFPPHAGGLHLTHNEHHGVYKTAADWIAEHEADGNCFFEWVSDEERKRAIEADSIWTLQWYPYTPVGFLALGASSLAALLRAIEARAG